MRLVLQTDFCDLTKKYNPANTKDKLVQLFTGSNIKAPNLGASHQQSGQQVEGEKFFQSIKSHIIVDNCINTLLLLRHDILMFFLNIFFFFFAVSAFPSTTLESEVSTYSNYIWRGTTFSENRPVLQLTMDVENSSGLFISSFFSNAEFEDQAMGENSVVSQEVDLALGKRWRLNETEIQFSYNRFIFPGAEVFESDELNLYLNFSRWILELSFMDDYFGYEGAYRYVRIGYEWIYSKDSGGTLFIGHNSFDNPKGEIKTRQLCPSCSEVAETTTGAGNPDYIDIYLSNRKTLRNNITIELAFNWTNRFEYTVNNGEISKAKAKDFATIVGMSLPFEL